MLQTLIAFGFPSGCATTFSSRPHQGCQLVTAYITCATVRCPASIRATKFGCFYNDYHEWIRRRGFELLPSALSHIKDFLRPRTGFL